MVPGIGVAVEAGLAKLLDPSVTDVSAASLLGRDFVLLNSKDEEARRLGIQAIGEDVMVVVTDPTRRLGEVRLQSGGHNNLIFFDNARWGGNFYATIRVLGSDCALLFNDIADAYVAMPDIYLRSNRQFLFWGTGASAVGMSMEIEGEGAGVVIGDDALISAGVWVRNHDMHAIHDLASGVRLNKPPVSTVLERHVWLGQDAMLLSAERIGMGAIVGARALVKGRVPPRVVVAGTPARVIREGTSWGRNSEAMTEAERVSIGLDAQPQA
jgi:acetyltransferase-like isoleucine patch superfamily enzyme